MILIILIAISAYWLSRYLVDMKKQNASWLAFSIFVGCTVF